MTKEAYRPFVAALKADELYNADKVIAEIQTAAAVHRVHLEHAEMAALLKEYRAKSQAVVDPSPTSLISRTRALLARIEAAP